MNEAQTYILTGFMGAGKSSVGVHLARLLDSPFLELDEIIETREGRTIPQIFRELGEATFREIEHQLLRELLSEQSEKPQVVALGGGAFTQPRNLALIAEKACTSIFLDAPVEELFARCIAQKIERPLRGDFNDFRNLYETRRKSYLTATLRVDTSGKNVEMVAREVACSLGFPNFEH